MRPSVRIPEKGEAKVAGLDRWIVLLLLLVFATATALTLRDSPGLTYDEGWALMVAKNWAEGHGYTQSVLDKPVPPKMLNIGFPAIAPMALSLRTFGVGIVQGRLPSLLFTIASLGLLYFLTLRLFDPAVARTALFALLFLSMGFTPFFWGRLAIGEPSAAFCLLAGFAVFLAGEGHSKAYLILSGSLLAFACVAKIQFLPFVTAGLIAPLALLGFRRSAHLAKTSTLWLGSFCFSYAVVLLIQRVLDGDQRLAEPGLYSSTAFVPNLDVRLSAVYIVVTHGLPTVLALVLAGRRFFDSLPSRREIAGVALLTFSICWVVWYVSCSVGWARYMYPCILAGSPFVGKLLTSLIAHARLALKERRLRASAILVPLTAGLLIWPGALTAIELYDVIKSRDDSLIAVAGFLDRLPKEEVIESFDLQVFFLIGTRQYHYPPDRVLLLLNRRGFLGENVSLNYDLVTADPDYLVVGPASRWLRVYDSVLSDTRQFVPVGYAGSYEVYRRARPAKASGGS